MYKSQVFFKCYTARRNSVYFKIKFKLATARLRFPGPSLRSDRLLSDLRGGRETQVSKCRRVCWCCAANQNKTKTSATCVCVFTRSDVIEGGQHSEHERGRDCDRVSRFLQHQLIPSYDLKGKRRKVLLWVYVQDCFFGCFAFRWIHSTSSARTLLKDGDSSSGDQILIS